MSRTARPWSRLHRGPVQRDKSELLCHVPADHADETGDGIWSIYFGTVLLAKVEEREMIIRD